MKIQTSAIIVQLLIDGNVCKLSDHKTIELEFSAIDTGGGFKDPMLDFSFSIKRSNAVGVDVGKDHEIKMTVIDPQKDDNEITFSFTGNLNKVNERKLQANGRLKEDQLSKDLVGFVMKRFQ